MLLQVPMIQQMLAPSLAEEYRSDPWSEDSMRESSKASPGLSSAGMSPALTAALQVPLGPEHAAGDGSFITQTSSMPMFGGQSRRQSNQIQGNHAVRSLLTCIASCFCLCSACGLADNTCNIVTFQVCVQSRSVYKVVNGEGVCAVAS